MSEAHIQYTGIDSIPDVMYAIFQFMDNGGTGRAASGVRWADNDITHAVNNGSGFAANSAAVTSSSYFLHNSYIVIESASTMPSGTRWQVKIKYVVDGSYNRYFYYDFAPRGGWDSARESFYNVVSSGDIKINDDRHPTDPSIVYVSCSDLDTYGASSAKVEYFRFMVRETEIAEDSQFHQHSLRVGGYIPTDSVNDTNPACALAGIPTIHNQANAWGYVTADVNSLNTVTPDTDGSETDLSNGNAYGYVTTTALANASSGNASIPVDKTRAGQWVNYPVFLVSTSAVATVGYFGKYDMFGCANKNRTDGSTDSNGTYIVGNNILFRWNP